MIRLCLSILCILTLTHSSYAHFVFVVPTGIPTAGPAAAWSDVKSLLLAVEILSPSSLRTDRVVKRDFYLANGVAEYWIIDLEARVLERWTPAHEAAAGAAPPSVHAMKILPLPSCGICSGV